MPGLCRFSACLPSNYCEVRLLHLQHDSPRYSQDHSVKFVRYHFSAFFLPPLGGWSLDSSIVYDTLYLLISSDCTITIAESGDLVFPRSTRALIVDITMSIPSSSPSYGTGSNPMLPFYPMSPIHLFRSPPPQFKLHALYPRLVLGTARRSLSFTADHSDNS